MNTPAAIENPVEPSDKINGLVWPEGRWHEALELLARRAGLNVDEVARAARPEGSAAPAAPTAPAAPAAQVAQADLAQAAHAAQAARAALAAEVLRHAERVGLEAEAVTIEHGACARVLCAIAPALVRAPRGWLVVTGASHGRVHVIDAALGDVRVPVETLRALLSDAVEAPHAPHVDRLLREAGVHARRAGQTRTALLALRAAGRTVATAFLLRRRPGDTLSSQLRELGTHQRVALHVAAFGLALALDVLAWSLVGKGALSGRLDWGFLLGWGLLLLTALPVHALGLYAAGLVATDLGVVLKRRLLAGALTLAPEEVRHLGAGAHLSRAIEAEEVEALALSGASLGAAALLETSVAVALLSTALGPLGALLALVHLAFVVVLARRFFVARRAWTHRRLALTHGLVERLVGHRTRLAQEPRAARHIEEDADLDGYLASSRRLDGAEVALTVAGGRGFLLASLVAIAPAFVDASHAPAALAVVVGAALLGQRAWRRATAAMVAGCGAAIAWRSARTLADAAARPTARANAAARALHTSPDAAVFEARDVTFRHHERGAPVLHDVNVRVRRGERVLLEGPSGCGKSTLASLVTGLRTPSAGLALLGGVDHKTLGADAWRAKVASAPQFHENHILTGTLAFNVLLGRAWPPTHADLQEAEEVLRALDLGPLLARMPSGMLQVVGETGWQLSHGEKSRIFLARALLQRADMVVLDETFGALDPKTMSQALRATFARSETLLVIAHP
jgi:ATP-binding cassette subfamily B protein